MKIACVIPHYHHLRTVFSVAERAKQYVPDVWIVDDGSTDLPEDFADRAAAAGIHTLFHKCNQGKGMALRTAAAELERSGYDYMIVMDADGQHDPDDLPRFLEVLKDRSDVVVVGCRDFDSLTNVPRSSRFGRKFSNFWCCLETGVRCDDTQSGFRAYPVAAFRKLRFLCARYNFEIEILVRLLWGGYDLVEVPVRVTYENRITHFDPWRDNFRLSMLHTWLVTRRLLPIPHQRLVTEKPDRHYREILRHPLRFIRRLLKEDATPSGLALAAAIGTFLAVLPLIGVHMLVILYVCIRLRLNKIMALAIQNLFMPPLSPFLCIELGYFLRYGEWLTDFTLQTCLYEMHHRLYEWLLGSLVLAPVFAVLIWFIVYGVTTLLTSRQEQDRPNLSDRRGNWLGIGFFKLLLLCRGYRLALGCAYIVTWFYAVFDRAAYRSALPYLESRFPGKGSKRRHFHRLIFELARMLLVSFRAGTGEKVILKETGVEHTTPDGQILLFAHFSCWQLAMLRLGDAGRTARIMARPDKNGNLDKYLSLSGKRKFDVISTEGFAGGLLDAAASLEEKISVVVMGDRAVDGAASIQVPFLNGTIDLPLSPWLLAARTDVPVVPVFAELQEKPLTVTIHYGEPIRVPPAGNRKPRKEELQTGAEAYGKVLAAMAQKDPYHFFCFRDRKAEKN